MSKQQIILGLSGPPRAGKDTTARILQRLLEAEDEHCYVGLKRMSAPLKEIALTYLPPALRKNLEENKDKPLNPKGTTWRSLQIDAYRFGAERLGPDWLGHHMLQQIKWAKGLDYILVPDFGRPEEVAVLLRAGLIVRQLKIYRPGTAFSGDSRVDFTLPHAPHSHILINDGDLDELELEVKVALEWLESTLKESAPAVP